MRILRVIFETLCWLLLVSMILLLAAAMGYVGIFFIMLLFPLAVQASAVMRRRRGSAVIAYLEQAVRLNLPLAPMMAAARASEQGVLSSRLGQLSRRLDSGSSVASAVRLAVPELQDAPAAAIESGERLGRLPHALRRLASQNTRRAVADSTDIAFARAYPFIMATIICAAVSMLMVFVIPKFETIFKDFGTRLPWVTQVMLDAARNFGSAIMVLTLVALLVWVAVSIWRVVHPRSAAWLLRGTRDRILWALPLAHGYVCDRGMAEALDLIAEAMRAGQPIDHAVDEAAKLHVNCVLQSRLAELGSLLAAGTALPSAVQHARLPGLLSEMLAPAQTGQQAIEVIAFLARYYDARFSRTRVVIQAASVPVMVFVFGFLVAWVALGMLMPLSTLISSISVQTSSWRP